MAVRGEMPSVCAACSTVSPGEIPQLHKPRHFRLINSQLGEGVVQCQQILMVTTPDNRIIFLQFVAFQLASTLGALPATGIFNQNPTHRFGGRRKEVTAVVKLLLLATHQAEIRLMDQGRRIERQPDRFVDHLPSRQPTQLFVHQRQELARSLRIPLFDLGENLCDIGHEDQNSHHAIPIPPSCSLL